MSEATMSTQPIAGRYLSNLLEVTRKHWQLASNPSEWLTTLRSEAVERVGVLALPSTRDEEWRFTDITPFAKMSFTAAQSETQLEVADIAQFFIEEVINRQVFVDGIYADCGVMIKPCRGKLTQGSEVDMRFIETVVARHVSR